MRTVVRNHYKQNGRYKYRVVIPLKLRPYIEDNITEYVRWLGPITGTAPSTAVLGEYATATADYDRRIALAKKRQAGTYDEVTPELIEHIIAEARADLYEDDLAGREDDTGQELYEAMALQLSKLGIAPHGGLNPDRPFDKRQESLEAALESLKQYQARGRISSSAMDEAEDRLAQYGLNIDRTGQGFEKLAREYQKLLIEVYKAGLERQTGEVVENPKPPAPFNPSSKPSKAVSIVALADIWWKNSKAARRSKKTHEAYIRTAKLFAGFLGHDNAAAVTRADVVRFKDRRLADGVSPQTVKAGDLSALSAMYKEAIEDALLSTNPADKISVKLPKEIRTRTKGYTNEEVVLLLRHASAHTRSEKEGEKRAASKKWVPWLLAYTGARVGEMVQLRKEDVLQRDGHWIFRITPEAGTVKTSLSARSHCIRIFWRWGSRSSYGRKMALIYS